MEKLQQYLKERGHSEIKVDGIIGNQTLSALQIYISKRITENNFKFPKKGIVWIRTDEKLTNTFDDFGVLILDSIVTKVFPCSTTAGKYYIQNPITTGGITGTAVTVSPQQVLGSHQFNTSANWKSLWLGAPFFRQIKNLKIYRDGNKDSVLDKHTITNGLYGINFHRGGLGSFIDNWSAGCHVTKDAIWFDIQKLFTNGEIIDYTIIS
jgi:hypothetical protein